MFILLYSSGDLGNSVHVQYFDGELFRGRRNVLLRTLVEKALVSSLSLSPPSTLQMHDLAHL